MLLAVAGYAYISLGYAPVATASAPLPFERAITSIALNATVRKYAPQTSPIPADEANLTSGARIYRQYCAVCHGLIDQPEPVIGRGEFPKPPQLLKGKGMTGDPVGQTYWKITHGIRLTGMPAFNNSLSENERWQLSLLVANANRLPSAARQTLIAPLQKM